MVKCPLYAIAGDDGKLEMRSLLCGEMSDGETSTVCDRIDDERRAIAFRW